MFSAWDQMWYHWSSKRKKSGFIFSKSSVHYYNRLCMWNYMAKKNLKWFSVEARGTYKDLLWQHVCNFINKEFTFSCKVVRDLVSKGEICDYGGIWVVQRPIEDYKLSWGLKRLIYNLGFGVCTMVLLILEAWLNSFRIPICWWCRKITIAEL